MEYRFSRTSVTAAGSLARRAAFLAQRVFPSDLMYVEPVFLGFNLFTSAYEEKSTVRTNAADQRNTKSQLGSPYQTEERETHPSGTLNDVNLNPVSSFFALGIPRGILPVPAFDFVVPEVASLEYG